MNTITILQLITVGFQLLCLGFLIGMYYGNRK